MADLRQTTIFLSAGFPSGERGEAFKPYDASGIADAVSVLVRAVLGSNGKLLFGGHPTITPLVLMIARELQVKKSVTIFQSAWFRGQQLPEIEEIPREEFGSIVWTEHKSTRQDSLATMRETMIKSAKELVAALFVGGMEGIVEEYDYVKEISSQTPCIPITGPGGAAARLPEEDCVTLGLSQLHKSRSYPLLAQRIIKSIAEREVNRGGRR